MAGVESRKLAFRRSTNATASRHVVPTFPTGVFYVFVFINIMFLSSSISEGVLEVSSEQARALEVSSDQRSRV